MNDWSSAEIAAELADVSENLPYLARQLAEAVSELAAQDARSAAAYGSETPLAWPAGSYADHKAREERIAALRERIAGAETYRAELEAAQAVSA